MSRTTTKPAQDKQNSVSLFLNLNFNAFLILIVFIFLIISYFLLIKPKFNLILITIKDNIAQQEQYYQSQKQKLVDLQAVATFYNKIDQAKIDKIKVLLPDKYAKEKLFGELEDMINQQGVLLLSIDLQQADEATDESESLITNDQPIPSLINFENIGVIQANISLSAVDYVSLKSILALLESHLQLVDVYSIEFDQEDKTADILLNTYYFK